MVLQTRRLLLGLLLGSVWGIPFIAAAQALGNTDPFTLSVTPQYPTPYSQVVLTPISASSLDLTSTTLTVTVDGKQIYEGATQSVGVPLGAPGALTTIQATLTANGTKYKKTLTIRPQDVVLIAEPIASAPVLYRGKPLVPLGGTVRIIAVVNMRGANGKNINPTALGYSWDVDGTKIANSSGLGRDVLLVASPLQYRDRTISLTVTSQDGAIVGGASLLITPKDPILRIYRNDPLLGIMYDHALSESYSISGAETSLYAAAYSFPLTTTPILQWFLNGTSAQTGSSITLRPTGSGQGRASVSVVASGSGEQSVTTNLSLSFGAPAGTGLFGL